MTCRGYDSKAVKIPKLVKRSAAQIIDPHKRGEFVRSYVAIAKTNLRSSGSRKDSDKE